MDLQYNFKQQNICQCNRDPQNIGMIYTGNVTIVNVNALLQLLILKHYYIKGPCR